MIEYKPMSYEKNFKRGFNFFLSSMNMQNVLIVSYGSRAAAMADALYRSEADDFSLYFADKQANPFNIHLAQKTGGQHAVTGLDVDKIYQLASGIDDLAFVVCGPEGPIINGLTDRLDELGVPVIAPRQEYAIEGSKARQRRLIAEVVPEANPDFRIFDKDDYSYHPVAMHDADTFMKRFDYQVVLKPISPQVGKGVVVYGDHFQTPEEALELFSERFEEGGVVVEEKLVGEESSFMVFSDGKGIFPLRDTRDYKRAFDGDKGPNTGGMGSYMDVHNHLPFMKPADRLKEEAIMQRIFEHMRGEEENPGLRGMPYYVAFIHTAEGPKILEINSRPGDPEILNVLPALETDFGEICLSMIRGDLRGIETKPLASVVTYLVPPSYGGKDPEWKGSKRLKTMRMREMMFDGGDFLKVYPGSMERRPSGDIFMLSSRTLAVVGLGETIEDARQRSLQAADEIQEDNPNLWRRDEIAHPAHIQASIDHMKRLRGVA